MIKKKVNGVQVVGMEADDLKYTHERVDFRVTDKNKILGIARFDSMKDYIDFFDNDVTKGSKEGRCSTNPKGYCGEIDDGKDDKHTKWVFGKYEGFNSAELVRKTALEGKCPRSVNTYVKRFRKELEAQGLYELPQEEISCKKQRVWCDDGAELDIDAVMSGDPDYWVKTLRNGKYRVVRLVVNYSASFNNNATTFAKTLAMTYVTAEIIEQLGYGVEIYATACCRSPYSNSLEEQATLFPLKRTQEPLDIQRMGFVGVVGFFRYYTFANENELFGNFNGSCRLASKEMQAFLGADVYITTSWSQGDQALVVRKAIEKITGKELSNGK